jgi:hypothetical protein
MLITYKPKMQDAFLHFSFCLDPPEKMPPESKKNKTERVKKNKDKEL